MALIAYWIAHPDSTWPGTPTGAQIAAGNLSSGSAAAYAGSETAPGSGSGFIDETTAVTGLTAETAYKIAWTVYDDVALEYAPVTVGTESTLSAAVTGTLAATEAGADTAALSGQVVLQGALAATESGSDTAALAGAVRVAGALSASEAGADTAAAAGQVIVAGQAAATEAGTDTAALAGAVIVAGALSATEAGSDTAALNGSSAVTTTGTLDAQEAGSDTAALTGAALVQGLLDALESGADTGSLVGQIIVEGALSASEVGGDTASAAGQIIVIGALEAAEVGSDTALLRYIPPGTGADPAEVWSYVLANGLTAGENMVENNRMLRIVLAALSGTTAGIGSATETYFGEDGTTPRVIATFDGQGNRVSVLTDGAP